MESPSLLTLPYFINPEENAIKFHSHDIPLSNCQIKKSRNCSSKVGYDPTPHLWHANPHKEQQ